MCITPDCVCELTEWECCEPKSQTASLVCAAEAEPLVCEACTLVQAKPMACNVEAALPGYEAVRTPSSEARCARLTSVTTCEAPMSEAECVECECMTPECVRCTEPAVCLSPECVMSGGVAAMLSEFQQEGETLPALTKQDSTSGTDGLGNRPKLFPPEPSAA